MKKQLSVFFVARFRRGVLPCIGAKILEAMSFANISEGVIRGRAFRVDVGGVKERL